MEKGVEKTMDNLEFLGKVLLGVGLGLQYVSKLPENIQDQLSTLAGEKAGESILKLVDKHATHTNSEKKEPEEHHEADGGKEPQFIKQKQDDDC